jgi:hypothetical protein
MTCSAISEVVLRFALFRAVFASRSHGSLLTADIRTSPGVGGVDQRAGHLQRALAELRDVQLELDAARFPPTARNLLMGGDQEIAARPSDQIARKPLFGLGPDHVLRIHQMCYTERRSSLQAHRACHSRFSRSTIPAKESPCRRSKDSLSERWYAPGAWVWQSAQRGTQE